MKDEDFALSRILELERRSKYNDTIECSYFFSYSELYQINMRLPKKSKENALIFGGWEEAESRCFFFLPDYLSREDFLEDRLFESYIGCYLVELKFEAYAKPLTHKSLLGSLMGLGIKREMLGDIYVEDNRAVFFAHKTIEKDVLSMEKIGNDKVKISSISYIDSPIKPAYETIRITYDSNRFDSILSECFHISREEAKRQILAGNAFLTSSISPSPNSEVQPLDHLSIKGKGKVTFLGEIGSSKKGKIVATIKKSI